MSRQRLWLVCGFSVGVAIAGVVGAERSSATMTAAASRWLTSLSPEQRQNHAVVVGQKTHRVPWLLGSIALQTEVLFEEAMCFWNIGHSQVQVGELHIESSEG